MEQILLSKNYAEVARIPLDSSSSGLTPQDQDLVQDNSGTVDDLIKFKKSKGALIISEGNVSTLKRLAHVAGKGKDVDLSGNFKTPNLFKKSGFNPLKALNHEASSSSKNIYVNKVDDPNAIPALGSKINADFPSSVHENVTAKATLDSTSFCNVFNKGFSNSELQERNVIPEFTSNPWIRAKHLKINFNKDKLVLSEDGTAVKLVESCEISNAKRLEFSVVVKVFGKELPPNVVAWELRRQWASFGKFHFTSLGKGWYLCSFKCLEAFEEVLSGGPWFVNQHIVGMEKWSTDFSPSSLKGLSSPIWIRMPHLPLQCWDEDNVALIASMIGVPLMLDGNMFHWRKREFARRTRPCPGCAAAAVGRRTCTSGFETAVAELQRCRTESQRLQTCPPADLSGSASGVALVQELEEVLAQVKQQCLLSSKFQDMGLDLQHCVRLELDKPLPLGVWVDGIAGRFFQKVEYEKISTFCYNCGMVGVYPYSSNHVQKGRPTPEIKVRRQSNDVKFTNGFLERIWNTNQEADIHFNHPNLAFQIGGNIPLRDVLSSLDSKLDVISHFKTLSLYNSFKQQSHYIPEKEENSRPSAGKAFADSTVAETVVKTVAETVASGEATTGEVAFSLGFQTSFSPDVGGGWFGDSNRSTSCIKKFGPSAKTNNKLQEKISSSSLFSHLAFIFLCLLFLYEFLEFIGSGYPNEKKLIPEGFEF
ncbi:hypothetical protein M5K25_027608 [Dendrobium thyrsiflorum]|uniref:DUF4283 domain-containing protein n=1 Tax=Dendrobium thyrsiflorum TaxID=117978 RepID=A0ABD0TUG1_DENTH